MGTAITAKNSNAENAGMRKFSPPVSRSLEAWHFLNEGVAKAATNYALGKNDAQVIGAPLEFPSYIQFKGLTNYLQTEVKESATSTTFSVIRTKDTLAGADHTPAFYGNYRSGVQGGSYLAVGINDGLLTKVSSRFSNVGQSAVTSSPITLLAGMINLGEWSLVIDITKSGFNAIQNATTGLGRERTDVTYGRSISAEKYRVGSMHDTSTPWKGTADMALWAHYSTELTPSEIASTVAVIRAYMLRRFGIAV